MNSSCKFKIIIKGRRELCEVEGCWCQLDIEK